MTPLAAPTTDTATHAAWALGPPLVYLIDDDAVVREGLGMLLRSRRLLSEAYDSAQAFEAMLADIRADAGHWPHTPTCVVLDVRMPGTSGLALFDCLLERGYKDTLPVLFLTGHGDVPTAVAAVQRGAFDFVEKPFSNNALIDRVEQALAQSAQAVRQRVLRTEGLRRIQDLTARERSVMWRVAEGLPNKRIAQDLQISVRTVEAHRARLYDKLNVPTPFAMSQLLQACGVTPPATDTPLEPGSAPR